MSRVGSAVSFGGKPVANLHCEGSADGPNRETGLVALTA